MEKGIEKLQKFEVTATVIVKAKDEVDALDKGRKMLKNIDIEIICDISSAKLHVRKIKDSGDN